MKRRAYKGVAAAAHASTRDDMKCAWVVLLMAGNAYEPGALVVAQSLRTMKTQHALVCMVTDDVPAETQVRLRGSAQHPLYDDVIGVPYITQKTRPFKTSRQSEMYSGWIDHSFTKWNCLLLTQYSRVIVVDADVVVMANCDDLFELRPPAACYSNPWAWPCRLHGGLPNPYLSPPISHGGLPHPNPIPPFSHVADLPHGTNVKAEQIEMAVNTASFVGWGALVLLAPNIEKHAALLAMIRANMVFGEEYNAISGSDEVSIALLYARAGEGWTHIHQRYLAIPWKWDWVSRDIRAYHFHGRKPWVMAPSEWPDLADWWDVADRIIVNHPELHRVFYSRAECLAPPASIKLRATPPAPIGFSSDKRAINKPHANDCPPKARRWPTPRGLGRPLLTDTRDRTSDALLKSRSCSRHHLSITSKPIKTDADPPTIMRLSQQEMDGIDKKFQFSDIELASLLAEFGY